MNAQLRSSGLGLHAIEDFQSGLKGLHTFFRELGQHIESIDKDGQRERNESDDGVCGGGQHVIRA